jgi:hypothetical protein
LYTLDALKGKSANVSMYIKVVNFDICIYAYEGQRGVGGWSRAGRRVWDIYRELG